jgi:conserved oligomeric Golgi complex subunit 3
MPKKLSTTDSQLFLVKNLLILKAQIVAFDFEFVTPDISFDFSTVTGTFWELRERGGLFDPRNLMRLLGQGLFPTVVETMLDAKVELDGRLRTVINDFTSSYTFIMTKPIDKVDITKKGFDAEAATQSVRTIVQKETPQLRKKLDEYLEDPRTKETLVGAIQDLVVEKYEEFHDMVIAEGGNLTTKSKGKGRVDEVWDVDAFAEWAAEIFQVGEAGMREVADDDSRAGSQNGDMSV